MAIIKEYTERAKNLGANDMISISFKEMRGDDVVLEIDLCPYMAPRIHKPTCSCGSTKEVEFRTFNLMDKLLRPELCIDCWWEFLYEHSI